MRFAITEKGGRTLIATKKELKCVKCLGRDKQQYYYCEMGRYVICRDCIYESPCEYSYRNHTDFMIDRIEIKEDMGVK